ncbi:hypothetical protein JCGZ_22104 [Jatropha curcas]|uniref:Uncharacterized protein n=1 Tax=Jatropha curcas TaxID=180498 RepID=A0A067K3F2_JATCU|nr:hypothetical protein JCGZ_22104 [Jatropha curcas]
MLSTRSIWLEQDIAAAWRGSTVLDHLAAFVSGAYAIFVRTQLLIHLPPPANFDPFTKVEELDRGKDDAPVLHLRVGSDSRASDMTVIIGKLEYGPVASFSFTLDSIGQITQGMLETHLVSIVDYNDMSELYELAYLKLAVARLSGKHISRASMAPLAGRGQGAQRYGHDGHRAGRRPVIVKETEESSSKDSKETASNMS